MRSPIRAVFGMLVAVGLAAGVAALSRAPYATGPAEASLVRLSWRARGQQVEECRPLTQEERERLPAHMRPSEICERRGVPYLLEVTLDDRAVLTDTVHPGGARADRPVYVYREIAVSPGEHELRVRFAAVAVPEAGSERSEVGGPTVRDWLLERVVELEPGQILLVTRSESEGKLEPRTTGSSER